MTWSLPATVTVWRRAFCRPLRKSAAHWISKGFRMISLGSDIGVFLDGMRKFKAYVDAGGRRSMKYSVRAFNGGTFWVPGPEVYWMEAWNQREEMNTLIYLVQGGGQNILINTGPPQDLTVINQAWLDFLRLSRGADRSHRSAVAAEHSALAGTHARRHLAGPRDAAAGLCDRQYSRCSERPRSEFHVAAGSKTFRRRTTICTFPGTCAFRPT